MGKAYYKNTNKMVLYFLFTGKSSESENKSRVTAIHTLKEKLKTETDKLRVLKQQLTEIQEKQQLEKEVNIYHACKE